MLEFFFFFNVYKISKRGRDRRGVLDERGTTTTTMTMTHLCIVYKDPLLRVSMRQQITDTQRERKKGPIHLLFNGIYLFFHPYRFFLYFSPPSLVCLSVCLSGKKIPTWRKLVCCVTWPLFSLSLFFFFLKKVRSMRRLRVLFRTPVERDPPGFFFLLLLLLLLLFLLPWYQL